MSKLYTEEQVKRIISHFYQMHEVLNDNSLEKSIDSVTPIELPSDEEIENNAYNDRRVDNWEHEQQIGFERGAKWMRDKIQGGNNE
jgi:hypothetical protein